MAYQAGRNRIRHRENDAAVAHVLPRPLRKSGPLDVLAFELNGGDAGGVRLPGGRHHPLGALVRLDGADIAELDQRLHGDLLAAAADHLGDPRALLDPIAAGPRAARMEPAAPGPTNR